VIIIEHNTEVIKSSDWVIDLGPEGGNRGGHLTFAGTPEDLGQRAGELYREVFEGEFRVIRTTLQGFQILGGLLLSQLAQVFRTYAIHLAISGFEIVQVRRP